MRAKIVLAVAAILFGGPVLAQEAKPLFVVSFLEVRTDQVEEAVALAAGYVEASQEEAGNRGADLYQEVGRHNRLVLVESWQERTALDAHLQATHVSAFVDQLPALSLAPMDQRFNYGFILDNEATGAGSDALYVVTHVDVPGAFREQAETLLRELLGRSQLAPGQLRYEAYQQVEPRLNHFNLLAVWQDRDAFAAYASSAPALAFREALAPLVGALYDERLYRRLQP